MCTRHDALARGCGARTVFDRTCSPSRCADCPVPCMGVYARACGCEFQHVLVLSQVRTGMHRVCESQPCPQSQLWAVAVSRIMLTTSCSTLRPKTYPCALPSRQTCGSGSCILRCAPAQRPQQCTCCTANHTPPRGRRARGRRSAHAQRPTDLQRQPLTQVRRAQQASSWSRTARGAAR